MPAARQACTSSAAVSAVSATIGISVSNSADRACGVDPAEHRHAQVEDDGVEAVARGGVDRGLAVLDQRRGDPEPLELHADQAAQRGVVLGDQHAAGGERGRGRGGARPAPRSPGAAAGRA